MGDRIRGILDAGDEKLDLLQHAIDRLGELVELVRCVLRRQSPCQIALNDGVGRAIDRFNPLQHRPAHQESPGNGQDERGARRPIKPLQNQAMDGGAVLDVTSDQ